MKNQFDDVNNSSATKVDRHLLSSTYCSVLLHDELSWSSQNFFGNFQEWPKQHTTPYGSPLCKNQGNFTRKGNVPYGIGTTFPVNSHFEYSFQYNFRSDVNSQ